MIRLTTIGTGTGAPSPTRVSAAHLVESGDCHLLIDCGSGSVHRMASLGIDWMAITHLAVSHFHADHISDIPTLLYAWRYGKLPPRTAPVQLIGPPGFVALFDRLDEVFGGDFRALGFGVEVTEITPGDRMQLGPSISVSAHKVPHTDQSVAYSIGAGRRRLVYTGDTAFDAELAAWAFGCDLLLAECSLPEELAVPAHMTPAQCAELAARARPSAFALTHFYPPLEQIDVARIISARYDGPVHLAYDGWTIELGD